MLGNETTQPSKFRTKKWFEINNESRGEYCTGNQLRFKTTMLRSSLCAYSNVHILVNGTITITGDEDGAAARRADGRNKQVTFKNCAPFTNFKGEINNLQIVNATDLDVVMLVYNSRKYSDNYAKTLHLRVH